MHSLLLHSIVISKKLCRSNRRCVFRCVASAAHFFIFMEVFRMGRDWNSIMFDNIGEKIKKVAKVTAWIGIVVSIIGGIVLFFWGLIELEYLWFLIFLAPITVVVGCIMAWLSVIMLYGFGELIENSKKTNKEIRALNAKKVQTEKNAQTIKVEKSRKDNDFERKENIQQPQKEKAPSEKLGTIVKMGAHRIEECDICGEEKMTAPCDVKNNLGVDIKRNICADCISERFFVDIKSENQENDLESEIVCHNCKSDLSFMGYTEDDLKENPTCPFCNERINL